MLLDAHAIKTKAERLAERSDRNRAARVNTYEVGSDQHAQVCSQSTNTKPAYLLKAGSVKTTFGRSSGDNELATRFCALDAPQILYINVQVSVPVTLVSTLNSNAF